MPTSDYTPTVAEIGALVRSRTTSRGSTAELGTFTTETRPTAIQVTDLIQKGVDKVEEKVGSDLPGALWKSAKAVAAIRAAMLVELSFFGDQIAQGRSPYDQLAALYKEGLADLILAKKSVGEDGTIGDADDQSAAGMPSWSFPNLHADQHAPGAELPAADVNTAWMDW